jgi:hypothetical protein
LLSKFKILGIEDENNWTESKGEGSTYDYLLRLPIYNQCDQVPENMFKRDSEILYEDQPISWDKYFEAVHQNIQVGFISKHNKNNRKQIEKPRQPQPGSVDIYSDTNIEWDNIQDAEAADKKYKMYFKEITENEKTEIMKRIQNENGKPSYPQMKKQDSPAETQIISVEQIENSTVGEGKPSSFFNEKEEEENQLAICKENIDARSEITDEILTEHTEIDASQITKVEDIEAVTLPSPIIEEETAQEEELVEPMHIISIEEIEKKQMVGQPVPNQSLPQQMNNSLPPSHFSVPMNQATSSNHHQNRYSPPTQMQQMQQYMMMQNEMETQKMIEKLNQEEIQKVMMQNSNLTMGTQNMNNVNSAHNINPFEPILRDNPTSTWLYKDPQGFVRGPFTCFDMYTWHNEGYFSEDLELSIDNMNFFTLGDLRAVNYRNNPVNTSVDQSYPNYQQPNYQGMMYGDEKFHQGMSQHPQMHGQMNPGMVYPQYSGHPSQMSYAAHNQESVYEQSHPHTSYSYANPMAKDNYGFNPYYGHQ